MANAGRYRVDLMRDDMDLLGWLQADLAKHAGVSNMTVARFFTGTHQTARSAKKIATALGHDLGRYLIPRTSQSEAVA